MRDNSLNHTPKDTKKLMNEPPSSLKKLDEEEKKELLKELQTEFDFMSETTKSRYENICHFFEVLQIICSLRYSPLSQCFTICCTVLGSFGRKGKIGLKYFNHNPMLILPKFSVL